MDPSDSLRLGPAQWQRRTKTLYSVFTGAGSQLQVAQANPYRYWILFSQSSGGSTYPFTPIQPSVSGEGVFIPVLPGMISFNYHLHGEVVQEPWYIANYSLASGLLVLEGVWLPGVE